MSNAIIGIPYITSLHSVPPHIGTALSYQGNEISYTEMLQAIDKTADALSAMGFKAGDEIPVCVSNCPEFVYLFFAISKIGAVVNSFGNWFAKDYHVRILNDSGSTTAFISDDNYALLQEALEESAIQNVVVFSLQDSLPVKDGVRYNPYQAEQQEYLPEPLDWAAPKRCLTAVTFSALASAILPPRPTLTCTPPSQSPTPAARPIRSARRLSSILSRAICLSAVSRTPTSPAWER